MSAAPPLPGVLAVLAPIIDQYGYLAIGGFIALEDFGVPSPGETILIVGAVYAALGRLDIVLVGAVAVLAAVVGDNIGYVIGRFGGRALLSRYGRYVLLTESRIERAEEFFTRHGGVIVVVARFIEGLRQANGLIAGASGMPWPRFVAFNILGAVLWVAVWASLGYLAGDHIKVIYEQAHRYEMYVAVAIGVLIVAMIVRQVMVHRARSRHEGR